MKDKNIVLFGAFFLLLAVGIGAFGAHGLKEIVVGKYLETYKTGVDYQFYHGFALIAAGVLQKVFQVNLKLSSFLFIAGIVLFSFNCYFYAITQTKVFAMIVPLGGFAFIFGWFTLCFKIYKEAK